MKHSFIWFQSGPPVSALICFLPYNGSRVDCPQNGPICCGLLSGSGGAALVKSLVFRLQLKLCSVIIWYCPCPSLCGTGCIAPTCNVSCFQVPPVRLCNSFRALKFLFAEILGQVISLLNIWIKNLFKLPLGFPGLGEEMAPKPPKKPLKASPKWSFSWSSFCKAAVPSVWNCSLWEKEFLPLRTKLEVSGGLC